MRLVAYARTSTTDQQAGLDAQVRDLAAAGCCVIYNEQISSVAGDRPEFEAAIADLQPGDRLVVTKVDRLARSITDLWKIVDRVDAKGCGLRILNLGGDVVDTKSATGKLILTIFAGFAQFEREIMLERQKEGVAKAKADGKYKGCVPRAARKWPEVLKMHENGAKTGQIVAELGISPQSVRRILDAHGVRRHGPRRNWKTEFRLIAGGRA